MSGAWEWTKGSAIVGHGCRGRVTSIQGGNLINHIAHVPRREYCGDRKSKVESTKKLTVEWVKRVPYTGVARVLFRSERATFRATRAGRTSEMSAFMSQNPARVSAKRRMYLLRVGRGEESRWWSNGISDLVGPRNDTSVQTVGFPAIK